MEQPYDEQLAAKQSHVARALDDRGDLAWLPPLVSRESGFRNKAKMVVGGTAAQPMLGILDAAGRGVDARVVQRPSTISVSEARATSHVARRLVSLQRVPATSRSSAPLTRASAVMAVLLRGRGSLRG